MGRPRPEQEHLADTTPLHLEKYDIAKERKNKTCGTGSLSRNGATEKHQEACHHQKKRQNMTTFADKHLKEPTKKPFTKYPGRVR